MKVTAATATRQYPNPVAPAALAFVIGSMFLGFATMIAAFAIA